MNKFPSIEQYRTVVKCVRDDFNRISSPHLIPTLTFIGSPKLHGTNAGLRRFHDKIQPQSRERILDIDNDNHGFARFIFQIPESILHGLFDLLGTKENDITLYGEWIGGNIQKGVGLSNLPKQWVLFAYVIDGVYAPIQTNVHNHSASIYNIYEVQPFTIDIDFKNPEQASPTLEKLTLDVEQECPWTKHFGFTGIGEGIVWICAERPENTHLWFKTKGQKHSVTKVTKVASVDIEKVNNINACVDVILPEGRLRQGLNWLVNEDQSPHIPQNMGKFMKWVANDILKEETDTIEGNGFEWKDVVKVVNTRTREWYFNKMNEEFEQ
jgi:hypothetical protein